MTPAEMNERTMAFALRVMRFADEVPRSFAAQNAARQLVRSACSVAANYRAAQRARSHPDFASKIAVVLEEADEAAFWLELIERAGFAPSEALASLRSDAGELVRIFCAMRRTARQAR